MPTPEIDVDPIAASCPPSGGEEVFVTNTADDPVPVTFAGTGTSSDNTDYAVTAADAVILGANALRKSATIQNTGDANIRVRVGGAAAADRGFQLAPGASLVLSGPNIETGDVHAIREGGTDSTAYAYEVS